MSAMPHPTTVTASQLLTLREPGCRFELVRGEVRRMSPAGWWHGSIVGRLATAIGVYAESTGQGVMFGAETGFLIERGPDTVRAPDVAFVCSSRLPPHPANGWFPGPPDLAVEVVSPGDGRQETLAKAQQWIRCGARLVWVVQPEERNVMVHRADGSTTQFGDDATLHGEDVAPGLAIRIATLFR